MQFYSSKVSFTVNLQLLCKHLEDIFDFVEIDPYLKFIHHFRSTENPASIIDKKFFINIEDNTLYLSVSDGYRILIYTQPTETKANKVSFSIDRNIAHELYNYRNIQKATIFSTGQNVEIYNGKIKIFQAPTGKGIPNISQYAKTPFSTEVLIDGQIIQRESSLFGNNEQFELQVNPNEGQMILTRSKTNDKSIFKCIIKGERIIRYVKPIYIYPFFLFLKNEKNIIIRFHIPLMIELKDTNIPELTYFVMPFIKNRN